MAGRPIKEGLDYFELDCHMDEKVRLIQAEFGYKSFAIVVKLFQKIYGEFGYYCKWQEDSLLLFMSENGVSSCEEKNYITEVVKACIRRDIFSEKLFNEYRILTSFGIQKRYLNATSKREKIFLEKAYLLISVPKNPIYVVINSISDAGNSISDAGNAQSRVEKSRVEKRKENTICAETETAPRSTQKPAAAFKLNDGSLFEVTDRDIETYRGLYPGIDVMQELRNITGWCEANPTRRKTRSGAKRFVNAWLARAQDKAKDSGQEKKHFTKFDNFEGRSYDMDDLETKLLARGLFGVE